MSSQRAFSLIETIIAAAVLGLLISGATKYLQHAEMIERQAQTVHQMDLLYRDLYTRVSSPLNLYVTASKTSVAVGNIALSACFLPNQSRSQCPRAARESPGIDFNAYAIATEDESAQTGADTIRIAGTRAQPVRYTMDGDICDPGECLSKAHITARTWFYTECVENTSRSSRCGTGARYQSDMANVYLELQYVPKPEDGDTPRDRPWDCKTQKYAPMAVMTKTSERAVLVVPRPSLEDACNKESFYSPIAAERILAALDDEGCNKNAAVAGYESAGKPICRCVPPFSPKMFQNRPVVTDRGPVCELNGQCAENEIFRGFRVFDDNRNASSNGQALRYSTKPVCVPFQYTAVECGDTGGRLRDFDFNCQLQCRDSIGKKGGKCRMRCGNSEPRNKCFKEK